MQFFGMNSSIMYPKLYSNVDPVELEFGAGASVSRLMQRGSAHDQEQSGLCFLRNGHAVVMAGILVYM